MPIIRGIFRAFILLTTVPLVPVCLVAVGVALLFGQRARFTVVRAATLSICRYYLFGFGAKLTIAGVRSPTAQVFVGNHMSYLDIFVAGAATGGVFVSRHDVKSWPVIGWFARLSGTVFIDRSSLRSATESSRRIVERVGQGARVTLFPEGGILQGEGVKSFKPFLISAVANARLVVQPFTIHYTHADGSPVTAANQHLIYWDIPGDPMVPHGWRLMKLKNVRVHVTFHAPVQAPEVLDRESVRRYVEQLREIVASGHTG